MPSSECIRIEQLAEEKAKSGCNEEAAELFARAGRCWRAWESFGRAAGAYERAYEHSMLCHEYRRAADLMMEAAYYWIRGGEHEKFELNCQIAADAYVSAAEQSKNPSRLVDAAFSAILGGDLELSRELIHAAIESSKGKSKELINLALMLIEYQFGDADRYIDAALARIMTRPEIERIRRQFMLLFATFVRTSLESEVAMTISSLAASTGLNPAVTEQLVRRGIDEGLIPGYIDDESKELIVDIDRADISDITRRRRPILSRDLRDPGAWDVEFDREKKGDGNEDTKG